MESPIKKETGGEIIIPEIVIDRQLFEETRKSIAERISEFENIDENKIKDEVGIYYFCRKNDKQLPFRMVFSTQDTPETSFADIMYNEQFVVFISTDRGLRELITIAALFNFIPKDLLANLGLKYKFLEMVADQELSESERLSLRLKGRFINNKSGDPILLNVEPVDRLFHFKRNASLCELKVKFN